MAGEGYPVWCDLTDLLGGEDFWKEIENVLRDRVVKFLFVTSQTSTQKDGGLQELAEAKEVAKKSNLKDFIIPLHIDDCRTNIEIKRINYIPFETSWSNGFAQLLKKLEKENLPKNNRFGPTAVSEWWKEHYSSESGLIDESEADAGLDLFQIASDDQCGYFKKDLVDNDWLSFDINGFNGRRQVVGYCTMNKDSGRKRFWHFGVSGRVYFRRKHYLAVNPHVVFSDDGETIWKNPDRMHKAKMKQCAAWYNHHWRDRILATMGSWPWTGRLL